ncbi:response regulator transcription factor [Paenibacillus bouchesdurhonensis]|uniref:response regulator transcription factor n=1 Tax=Paenibacillus bouchesdurhonensis TaxID=1870990 RepID=UPI000DA63D7F|nr:response regulator [Paenibacillus bouchesdurhonensis]
MDIKALLIDDEPLILNHLKNAIPWSELQIELVGTARNGVKGLELVMEFEPDIILCDIRMPLMDGLEFLQEIRKLGYETEVIMLTGYQEFEYARLALKHGVKDYILKPINYTELEASICKLADAVRSQRSEKRLAERQMKRMTGLAHEKMMFDVLMGFTADVPRYLAAEDEQGDELSYALILVDLDGYAQRTVSWTEQERKLWNFAVRNVLQEAIPDKGLHYIVVQMRQGEWCVLLQLERERARYAVTSEQMHEWARQIQHAVREHIKLTVSLSWDQGPIEIQALSQTYMKLQRGLMLYAGHEQLLPFTEEELARDAASVSEWQLVEEITSGLKMYDKSKVEQGLERLKAKLPLISEHSALGIEKFLQYGIIHLLREMRELDFMNSSEEGMMWQHLQHSHSVKDLLNVITKLESHIKELEINKKSSELLMISAGEYIQSNLSTDIGVDDIANHLNISSSYFSHLFKNHYGETFVEYLRKQRMELAKTMLRLTSRSVTEVGALVGYSDRRYFSKVFQRYTGVTPTEYREQEDPPGSSDEGNIYDAEKNKQQI